MDFHSLLGIQHLLHLLIRIITNSERKIYMLTVISFLVGTSQFVISGILDKVASSVGVSISAAGQLITVFALANAIGTPVFHDSDCKVGSAKAVTTVSGHNISRYCFYTCSSRFWFSNGFTGYTRSWNGNLRRHLLFHCS